MWLPIAGLTIGAIIGSIFTFIIPVSVASYLSIAVLAAMDSIFGGIKSIMNDKFDSTIFISGFFFNAILAALLAFIGDNLGMDIYLAAVVAFGIRIFNNLGYIRRQFIHRIRQRKAQKNQPNSDIKKEISYTKLDSNIFPAANLEFSPPNDEEMEDDQ